MASLEVKMQRGKRQNWRNWVMVSFLADLADRERNQASFSCLSLAITLSTCSLCLLSSSCSLSIRDCSLSASFFRRVEFSSLLLISLAGASLSLRISFSYMASGTWRSYMVRDQKVVKNCGEMSSQTLAG